MVDVNAVHSIKRQLRHTWTPFFSRFGRLTEPQIQAIPPILAGQNVLLAAPTASGKTEAIIAPLSELCLRDKWAALSIVYVVPTRALANDVLARIAGPMADLGLHTALKHGDQPDLSRKNIPNCLITTPESLDSLLSRAPDLLQNTRAIVVDEIHLIDKTYRGDQMRILLLRLNELVAQRQPHIYLMSATVADAEAVATRYVSPCQIVQVPGHRDIIFESVASLGEACDLARRASWKKLLVFCNFRETVEAVARSLTELWRPYPVVAHHGNLSPAMRANAEEVMRSAQVAVCVATSTLEVGIDVGDIDAVVLAEIPFSIFALVQRAGRGNRRKDITNLIGVVRSDEERCQLLQMVDMARAGRLSEQRYEPSLSVVVQQILSYLYGQPEGSDLVRVEALMSPLASPDTTRLIVQHLHDEELLVIRGGTVALAELGMDWGEKGSVHSNIPDSQGYRVVDVASHREIGRITAPFDDTFVLAGRAWRVIRVRKDQIVEVQGTSGKPGTAGFRRHHGMGKFHYLLPPSVRQ